MNPWTSTIAQFLQHSQAAAGLVDLSLKSFVVLLTAAAVCLGWRRGAAAARHLVWLLAVTGVLVLPLLSGLLPAPQKPLWSVRTQANAENELALTLVLLPSPASVNSVSPATVTGTPPMASPTAKRGGQWLAAHFSTGWAVLALASWLTGAAAILLSLAAASLRLRSLRRNAHRVMDDAWLTRLGELRADLRIGRRVTLLQSDDDVMPVTWGWWCPVILLPAEADDWSPERRRVVLLHELAHIKRWDCLTQMLARIACAVYWFNPLVWVAARRMCVERENACDDLVLNGGCKASDYAAHLVEIARSFRRVPHVAAIAMARSSQLEGRITAIVDASRIRRNPRAWVTALCGLGVLMLIATFAAQKSAADDSNQSSDSKPWYDARLRAFFIEKAAQARQLAGTNEVSPQVWPYFAAGTNGDWSTATNLWTIMRQHAHQYEGTTNDSRLDKVWGPILETDLAWECFHGFSEKYALAYGNDIINSIPPGAIYFGGTDPGRGVITAMQEDHVNAKPFYTITQNALADSTYLDYVRAMYGSSIYTATKDDCEKAFSDYTADVQRRQANNELKPGENFSMKDGHPQVSGQVAVMNINGLIAKRIFDQNPDKEFYVEESFPLDWMYPHLTPNGLIMKINREPLDTIPDAVIQKDREYWHGQLKAMLGDPVTVDSTVADIADFARKIYLRHDLTGFTGDPGFAADLWARKSYSKLRSSQAGVFDWRRQHAKSPEEKERMRQAAEFAFMQAFVICPESPEAVYRYVNLLISVQRIDDALIVARTAVEFSPDNSQLPSLVEQLERYKSRK